ncbi:MAG: fasciclin domain-containing protein [Leptonema sp. (in: bacteria)]
MKTKIILLVSVLSFGFCKEKGSSSKELGGGMASVQDQTPVKNIVQIAVGSKDHTTLVEALKAAGLVDALANPGPFTVFAPTNAAFDQVPKDSLQNLLKPENKKDLETVLYHHVFVGVLRKEDLEQNYNGKDLVMFDGTQEKVEIKNKEIYLGGAKVIGDATASNGMVYIVDKVLLPKK